MTPHPLLHRHRQKKTRKRRKGDPEANTRSVTKEGVQEAKKKTKKK